ncbi:hypothetical protein Ddye_014199 [Dipteronia dyeriana]|uniref:Uncharacterized protein n=1 Tax=Dipteronia dyeriana TaxID=168575 RepID=A0AAE0CKX8_9ROSI|nr:hypothetical protein Ddye_014199 [Dipteronia dyeriana]
MELEKVDYRRSNTQVPHMKGGEGEYSYAKNSSWQKNVILKSMPLIRESIDWLFSNKSNIGECLNFADLGCSSGPTAYLPTWQVIEAIDKLCDRLNRKPPMLQVFLNDQPGNDFNTLFKSLPSFYERLNKQRGQDDHSGQYCFIAAVPGSFYGRLFPNNSLHLVFSSYSVNWLSQAPKGMVSESGVLLNKDNIYFTKMSPPSVRQAYLDQFESDFTAFLILRGKELQVGGRMVLTFLVCDTNHPCIYELLGMAIYDLVLEGLIEKSKLESFNMTDFGPRSEEIMHVIQKEGSFEIHQIETFDENWVLSSESVDKGLELEKYGRGKRVAARLRSVVEPLLVTHFGSAVMDDMFQRFSIKITHYLETEEGFLRTLAISLIKK